MQPFLIHLLVLCSTACLLKMNQLLKTSPLNNVIFRVHPKSASLVNPSFFTEYQNIKWTGLYQALFFPRWIPTMWLPSTPTPPPLPKETLINQAFITRVSRPILASCAQRRCCFPPKLTTTDASMEKAIKMPVQMCLVGCLFLRKWLSTWLKKNDFFIILIHASRQRPLGTICLSSRLAYIFG